jgi:hypothetical protein
MTDDAAYTADGCQFEFHEERIVIECQWEVAVFVHIFHE